jgi:hypothetical protein
MNKSGLLAALIMITVLAGCHRGTETERILFDFESDSELNQLVWQCHSLYSPAQEHKTHGLQSLKLTIFPHDYSGMTARFLEHDWRGFHEFSLDVYNSAMGPLELQIRIDDRTESKDNEEAYGRNFILRPGDNHLCIPLSSLISIGTHRRLDLSNMQSMSFYMQHPTEKKVFYIDSIKLTRAPDTSNRLK